MLRLLFHVGVVILNCYTLWYDQKYVEIPFVHKELEALPLKARVIFLTMWCLVIQTIYFTVAALNDVIGSNDTRLKKVPSLRATKDTIFSFAFPLSFYVTGVFWTVYSIDRELIFPEYIDRTCPAWVNHVLHTTVLGFMVIELLTTFRKYPSKYVGFSILASVNISYSVFLMSLYFHYGVWVYPLFEVLSWPARILFVSSSIVFGYGIYRMCEKVNNFIWAKELKSIKLN